MSRTFATYIVLTGVAAVAVIVFPGFFLIGLFLGIFPGIVLALAPTAFLYSALGYALRWLLLKVFAARAGNARPLRLDRKSTRLNSSHVALSRMPSSA